MDYFCLPSSFELFGYTDVTFFSLSAEMRLETSFFVSQDSRIFTIPEVVALRKPPSITSHNNSVKTGKIITVHKQSDQQSYNGVLWN